VIAMYERELTLEIEKKDAPFAPDEELGKYVVRRWTFREQQIATIESSKEAIVKGRTFRELDLVDYEVQQILICVRETPEGLELTPERVGTLDPDVGGKLLKTCRQVNGITTQEKKGFLEPSDSTGTIPG